MDPVANTRICITCGQKKPLSDFRQKSQQKFVYESECKSCQKEKMLNDPDYTDTNADYLKRAKDATTHTADTSTPLENPFPEKVDLNKTTRKLRIR
jgi:cytochrome c5